MPKRGENIYHRTDGRWEGRYIKGHDNGGKIKYGYVYADTCADVKRRLTEAKSLILTSSTTTQSTAQTILYRDWLSCWLYRVQPTVKKSTHSKYAYMVDHYIAPDLGHLQVDSLSNSVLNEFVRNKLVGDYEGSEATLSTKTIKDIVSLIRLSLKAAAQEGYSADYSFQVSVPRNYSSAVTVLTKAEQARLEAFAVAAPTPKNIGILVCLFTGIRIGELCALEWADICFVEKVMHIRKTLQRIQRTDDNDAKTEVIIDVPKSNCSVREIPLPDFLVGLLQIASVSANGCGYVITGTRKPTEPRTYLYYFKSVLKQCRIDDIKFHALRSTFATRCVEAGFEIKSLSQILGHATVGITLNTYVNSSLEQKRLNMGKLCLSS